MESITDLINREQKLFEDKQLIKPWLQSKLTIRGINIVIERSDESKIVFKCKCSFNDKEELIRYKQERKLMLKHHQQSKEEVIIERKKIRDLKKKFNCPFRIRANYSYRSKNWSLVVMNEAHNHHLFPILQSASGSQLQQQQASSMITPAYSIASNTSSPMDAVSPLSSVNSPHGQVLQQQQQQQQTQPQSQYRSVSNYQYSSKLPSLPSGKRNTGTTVSTPITPASTTTSTPTSNTQYVPPPPVSQQQQQQSSFSNQNMKNLNELQLEFNNSLLRLNCNTAKEDEIRSIYVKLLQVLETSSVTSGSNGNFSYSNNTGSANGSSKTVLPSIQETFRYNHHTHPPPPPHHHHQSQPHSLSQSPQPHHETTSTTTASSTAAIVPGSGDNAFLRF